MAHLYNLRILKLRRRALRKQQIPSEARLWMALRNRQLNGFKFRRQYSIGNFIVDFYCPQLRLGVEVDGQTHYLPGRPNYDQRRQQWLEHHGIQVTRFVSSDVMDNLAGVIAKLEIIIDRRIMELNQEEIS